MPADQRDVPRRSGGAPSRLRLPPGLALGGTGLAQHAGGPANAAELVAAAWADGVRYFDTAPMYGGGRSERWLGDALRPFPREEYVLSTKVGRLVRRGEPQLPGEDRLWRFDFSAAAVARCVEESLERLGVDRLDVVLLHDPDQFLPGAIEQAWPVLERLRADGVVGAIGVGTTRADVLARLLGEVELDLALLAGRLSLVDGEAAEDVLPLVTERRVELVVASALHAGLVDGRDSGQFHYAPTPPAVVRRVAAIRAVCDRYATPIGAVALQLVLAVPGVSTVLTGAADAAQWRQNLGWSRYPVPPELWQELAARGLLALELPATLATASPVGPVTAGRHQRPSRPPTPPRS